MLHVMGGGGGKNISEVAYVEKTTVNFLRFDNTYCQHPELKASLNLQTAMLE